MNDDIERPPLLTSTPPDSDATSAAATAEQRPPADTSEQGPADAGAQPPTDAGEQVPPAASLTGMALPWLMLGIAHDMDRSYEEVEALLAWRPPVRRAPDPTPVDRTPWPAWGVTERPERITYAFCSRFKWRTWPKDQKRIVPSASSRSQYLRIATLPELWGKKLDALGTHFHVLRWIAAPDDFIERTERYERVIAGEYPKELLRRSKSAPQEAEPKPAPALTEEQFVRLEEWLKAKTGQDVHLPRESAQPRPAPEPPKPKKRGQKKQAPRKRGRPRKGTRGG